MKKLLLTAMIAAMLIVPFHGVAMARNQETSPEAPVSQLDADQDTGFVPGDVPAQTDAAQAMTPAIHAMMMAMFHYELDSFDFADAQLGWETLYNMLSLYGQMDERSEYLDEDLILPVETAMDFSSALPVKTERFSTPRDLAAEAMKAVFLAVESRAVTESDGFATARGKEGNPAPAPTSQREPESGRKEYAARLSIRCFSVKTIGSVIAVRLNFLFCSATSSEKRSNKES